MQLHKVTISKVFRCPIDMCYRFHLQQQSRYFLMRSCMQALNEVYVLAHILLMFILFSYFPFLSLSPYQIRVHSVLTFVCIQRTRFVLGRPLFSLSFFLFLVFSFSISFQLSFLFTYLRVNAFLHFFILHNLYKIMKII